MIKNLILDYNGVISNDFTLVFNGVTNIFKKFGITPLSYEQLREEYEIPLINFYRKHLPNPDIDKLNEYYFETYGKDTFPQPYPKAQETTSQLRAKGLHLIILSSHNKSNILDELERFGIKASDFDAIYGNVKDKREVIAEVMATHNFSPSETAYVGDTEHDIEAAKQAKITSIASTYGYKPKSKLALLHPDYYLEQLADLLSIVS